MGARLVDHARRLPLLLLRVFHIAQAEDQAFALAGEKREIELLRRNGLPAVGDAVGAAFAEDGRRMGGGAVDAEKGVAGGVKGGAGAVCPENRIVVAPLAVFGLVIDRAKLDLHLAGGVVALKV